MSPLESSSTARSWIACASGTPKDQHLSRTRASIVSEAARSNAPRICLVLVKTLMMQPVLLDLARQSFKLDFGSRLALEALPEAAD
jgi:hypothetical protein